MAEAGIGSSISKEVVAQIEARKRIVRKTTLRSSDDLLFLNSKTGWVRLSSGINTITDEEAQTLRNAPDSRYTIKGDNKLAGFNILQGGMLNPNRSTREGIDVSGIDVTESAGNRGAYENRVNSTGIRPMPGITGMTVQSKGTFGTLREAEVQLSAWTLEDFEIIERIYLRPGFTMVLEWGHSLYVGNDDTLEKDNIESLGTGFFKAGVKMVDILKTVQSNRKKSSNNYEAMVGYCKNFSWTYKPNGEYECTVSLVSTGEILESLKMLIDPRERGVPSSEMEDHTSEEGKEQKKSPFHFLFNKLSKISDNPFTIKEHLASESPSMGARLEEATGYYDNIDYKDHPNSSFYNDVEIDTHWLPLRFYLDVFNRYFAMVDESKDKEKDDDYGIVKFNTAYKDVNDVYISSKFITIPEHFSIDPTVCVLAHKHIRPKGSGKISWFGAVKNIWMNIDSQSPKQEYDDVLNILIPVPYVKGILDSAMGEDYELSKSALEIFQEILTGINTALGGINDLSLHYDEEHRGGTYFVIDRNSIKETVLPTLTLAGIDSIFTNITISSKLSNEIGSNIAIAAQGSAQDYSENVENLLNWNPNTIDRVRPIRSTSEKKKTKTQIVDEEQNRKDIEKEKVENNKQWVEDVAEFFQSFSGGGWKDSEIQAAKTNHRKYIVHYLNNPIAGKTKTSEAPIPVELSLTLEGLGGLKIGETFTVGSGILPSKYQGKFGYIITGLSHEVSNGGWSTTIKTQFYSIKKQDKKGISSDSTAPRTVIDFVTGKEVTYSVNTSEKGTGKKTTKVIDGVKYTNGEIPEDKLRFINKWKEYKGSISSDKGRVRFYVRASHALDKLLAAATAEKVYLKINSAYRTYEDQVATKKTYGSNAATPGNSNHGFGLAVDFSRNGEKLHPRMTQYEWLQKNATKFGFKRLKYNPKHPESWEAWHWEFQL